MYASPHALSTPGDKLMMRRSPTALEPTKLEEMVHCDKPVVVEPQPWEDDAAEAAAAPIQTAAKPTQKAEDILAMIRARQAK